MKNLYLLSLALTLIFIIAGCTKPKEEEFDNGSTIVFCEHSHDVEVGEESEEIEVPEGWEDWGEFPEEYKDDFNPPKLPSREELIQKFKDKLAIMKAQVGANSSNDISNITSAQVLWFNDVLKTDNWMCEDGTVLTRSTLVQTIYYVYAVYSFDQDKDYYIVEQEITLPNGNLWSDKVREKKYNEHNYKSKDFYLLGLRTENWMTIGGSYIDNVAITQYSPETVNNQTTYTEGISGNIGGTVGYTGGANATVNGGVSYSISKTWAVQDINVKNYVMSNPSAKDATWEWTTMKKAKPNFWMNDIEDPANLATTTARFSTSWLWIVDKPGKTDKYQMNMKVAPKYCSFSYYVKWLIGYGTEHSWTPKFNHNFVLTPPNRVKPN